MSDSISEFANSYPLSHGQRALWFMQRLAPDGVAYNFMHAARILTELDVPAFRRAIRKLVRRHPALRTTFTVRDGEPVQRIHDHMEFIFKVEDAARWSESQLNDRLAEEVYRPFDLAKGPLLRVFLFTRSAREHIVLLATHHIVADLWSVAVVMSELGELYSAENAGAPVAFKPLQTRYTDYVRQQAESLAGPEGERLWAYWRKRLDGAATVLNLPTDRPRPPVQTDRGAAVTLRLGQAVSQGLKALARAHGATPYMTLLAAFQTLLHRYTGQEDILVASPIMGRGREYAGLVGYFVNPLVLRTDFSGDPPFSSILAQTRQTALEAFEHGAFPFPLLVERLQPARDPSRPPLVQVVFAWQQTTRLVSSQAMASFALGESRGGRLELGKLEFESRSLEHRVAPFELMLLMAETGDELAATMEYNTDLFDGATIGRMLGHFQTLLEAIVAGPERRVSELPLLTEKELRQELVEWNGAQSADSHDQCVHDWFEEVAEAHPQAIAVIHEEECLTYQQLNERANTLAHYLMKRGIGSETVAGICLDRSFEMVVSLLGVLKSGGAFLPLDPAYPAERLAYMIKDSGASVVLTRQSLAEALRIADCGLRVWVSGCLYRNPQSAIRNPQC
ncbi:MAG: condensation domain-containing protein [Blastocatellales bacterium]